MDLKLNYEFSTGLLVEGHRRIVRTRYAAVRIYALTLLVAGAVLALWKPSWWMLAMVLMVGGPLTWAAFELQVRRTASKQMSSLGGPVETRLTEESIQQKLSTLSSEVRWDAVKSVIQTEHLWLLKINPVQAIHLPRRAFSAEAAAEFSAFLRKRGLPVA